MVPNSRVHITIGDSASFFGISSMQYHATSCVGEMLIAFHNSAAVVVASDVSHCNLELSQHQLSLLGVPKQQTVK